MLSIAKRIQWLKKLESARVGSAKDGEKLTFGQDLPFAGLHPAVRREVVVQVFEQFLHFFASLAFGEFV